MKAITQIQTSNIFEQYALKTRLSLLTCKNNNIVNYACYGKCVTQWEEISTIRFNEKLQQLEAVVHIKSDKGYSWPLCPEASQEYVRFFIDWDESGKYENAGLTSFAIHNSTVSSKTTGAPQQYIVRFNIYPRKSILKQNKPATIKIKAVLSWNVMPSANPNELPIFGNYVEGHVRIAA